MYGNFDGFNNQSLRFDLHLGVNFWATVNITDPGSFVTLEAITVASADFLWVCLVNTGYGTPFISALEARPLKDNLYPVANASRSLVLFKRINLRAGDAYIRYPDDPHDRLPPRPPSTPPRSTSPGIRTPGTSTSTTPSCTFPSSPTSPGPTRRGSLTSTSTGTGG
ncbi:unnamed protein product [Musa acuminata subsp. burmannicoides]